MHPYTLYIVLDKRNDYPGEPQYTVVLHGYIPDKPLTLHQLGIDPKEIMRL